MKINFFFKNIMALNICFLLFTTCQNRNEIKTKDTQKNDSLIKINIDNLEEEKQILFSSVFNGFKLLPLETKKECLIGNINQMEVFDSIIYVLDSFVSKALFIFNRNGKFVKKIGCLGKGPGEYLDPMYFSIDPITKNIFILDFRQRKIIEFSGQGNFLSQFSISKDFASTQISSYNHIVYVDNIIFRNIRHDYLLYSIDKSRKISENWLPNQIYRQGFLQPFNNSNNFFRTANDIKYLKTFFDTVFSVQGNNLRPYLAISTKNKITRAEIFDMNLDRDLQKFHTKYFHCKKFMGITDYMENSKLTMFHYRNQLSTHFLFYYPSNSEVHCTINLIDDLTQQTNFVKFYFAYDDKFITCIQNDFTEGMKELIDNLKNNRIKLSNEEKSKLEKLNLNSNPVLVIYDCKEKMGAHKLAQQN